MGQNNNKSVRNTLEADFRYIKKYSNGCYGETTLIEDKITHKKYALKEIITDNQEMVRDLKRKKKENNPHVIRLVDCWVKDEPGICSSMFQVYLLMDYEQKVLEQEIVQRQAKQQNFTPNQLRRLTLSAISALMHLSRSKSNFRVSVHNIFITPDSEAKMVDPSLFLQTLAQTQYPTDKGYNICEQPKITSQDSFEDQNGVGEEPRMKASIFYLGMTLLSCCLLNEGFQQEMVSNAEYNFCRIKKTESDVTQRYGKLGHLIQKMVKKNPHKRPTFNQILLQLTPKLQKPQVSDMPRSSFLRHQGQEVV